MSKRDLLWWLLFVLGLLLLYKFPALQQLGYNWVAQGW